MGGHIAIRIYDKSLLYFHLFKKLKQKHLFISIDGILKGCIHTTYTPNFFNLFSFFYFLFSSLIQRIFMQEQFDI